MVPSIFAPVARASTQSSLYLNPSKPHQRKQRSWLTATKSLLLAPQPDNVSNSQSAWSMLQEPLVALPTIRHSISGRKANTTALAAKYNKTEIQYVAWSKRYSQALFNAYRVSLLYARIWISKTQQSKRVLNSEGDVGDVTLTNGLLPVIDLLNKLIDKELQNDLVILPAAQSGASIKIVAGESLKNISLDHTIVLTSRRAYEMNAVTESKLTKFLVVVEEKRVPYVQPLEWTRTAFEAAGGNCMKAHLPQILMYSQVFGCSRFLLTDWKSHVAVHARVYVGTEASSPKRATLAYSSTSPGPMSSFDPFALGPRHALAMLAIDAMRSIGILDPNGIALPDELRPLPTKKLPVDVFAILTAGRDLHESMHRESARLDRKLDTPSRIAASNLPYRVELRRQREARESVPYPLPAGWTSM